MMKKIVIGLGVVGLFIGYSLWVRHEQPTIAQPTSLAKNQPSTSAPSNANNSSSGSGSTPNPSDSSNGGSSNSSSGQYKDGAYTGSTADAYYGNVQIQATIAGGKLTDVAFLQYPDTHDTSVMINQQAMPYLKQEAIQAQSANVQIVSGATFTSQAFIQSLDAALSQAKA